MVVARLIIARVCVRVGVCLLPVNGATFEASF